MHIHIAKPNFFIIFLSCWQGGAQRHLAAPLHKDRLEDALRFEVDAKTAPPCLSLPVGGSIKQAQVKPKPPFALVRTLLLK